MLEVLPQLAVSGALAGTIYAIIGLGVVMIYRATRVVNFAQGEIVTVGAYLMVVGTTFLKLPYAAAALMAIGGAALMGIIAERVLLRRVIKAPEFTIVFVTFAFGILIKNVLRLIFEDVPFSVPAAFAGPSIDLGIVLLQPRALSVFVVAGLASTLLALWFRFSKLGKAMRAVSQNQDAAALMGIAVKRVYSLTWAISGGLAAIAGLLLAPILGVDPEMGGGVLIKGFMAGVIGGFTSLPGVFVGGILLGVVETLTGAFISTAFKDFYTFVVLILIILLAPNGLFGKRSSVRV